MLKEIDNKFESILNEIKASKSSSTPTNPGSDTNDTQNPEPSGSKGNRSIGGHASNKVN